MSVYHVLKDGSTPKDITGHIVRVADADPLYRYIHSINRGTVSGKSTYQIERRRVTQ
jgi:hypothetical protein